MLYSVHVRQTNLTKLLAAANELDNLFLEAFNKGDAEAIMKLHWNSAELLAYPPGEEQVNGYAAVKEAYSRDFSANKGAILEYTDAYNMVFADVEIGYGTFKWTMPMEGDSPIVFQGRYSEVKAMKDGKMLFCSIILQYLWGLRLQKRCQMIPLIDDISKNECLLSAKENYC